MAILSDGKPISVRRLRFLELEDNVPYNVDPPYIHKYEVFGGVQEVPYSLRDWPTPPQKPDQPMSLVQPGSVLYAQWESYNLYQAVLLHTQRQREQERQYLVDCARYIKQKCIPAKDKVRVIEPEDYEAITFEAACPEVRREDLEAELSATFQGFVGWYANLFGSGHATGG